MRKLLIVIGLGLATRAAYAQCTAFAFNPFTGKLDCVGVNTITAGAGDIIGPASSSANHIPQFSDTTGKLLKDGLALVTTVGSPGANTSVPTEAAVRAAISAAGGVAFTGSQTATALVTNASTNTVQNPAAGTTLDTAGNLSTAGGYTAGAGGSAAGYLDLGQGTAPSAPASGHFQLTVATISAPYSWTVPAADAAGAVASNGSGALAIIGFTGTGNIARAASPTFSGTVAAAAMTLSGTLTTNLTGGGTQCVHVSNTGVVSGTGADCGAGGGGGGSGDVVGPSSATDDHLAGYNGTTGKLLRDSSVLVNHTTGDITTAGGITTGSGGSAAGYAEFGQGTAPSITASAVQILAPSTVSTGYQVVLPGASATGFVKGTNSSNVNTLTFVALAASDMPNVPVTISTSGPVSDPGGATDILYNNAAGALTFNLPAGVAGMQRCYRNATGKSGAITIAVTTSNAIDLDGADGTPTTGTLVSGGALGDSACVVSDAANHWYAYVQKGTWTNN